MFHIGIPATITQNHTSQQHGDSPVKTATIITIETILDADRSIPKSKREKIMDILLDRSPPPPPKKTKLITTKQAAEIIGIHPVSMRKLGLQGKIPVIRFSARKIRYDLEDVEAYAQGEGVSR